MKIIRLRVNNFPNAPGVYLMKDARGKILYVGKAVNIKKRVSQYFQKALDDRLALMMGGVKKIDYQKTPSVIEALILEANLIKKYQPKFNIREKDQKTFLYVWVTREKFPRIEFVRERELLSIPEKNPKLFGPYPSATSIRAGLEYLRKFFPYRSCNPLPKKACLYHFLDLCGAPCVGKIERKSYRKIISQIEAFLSGKKEAVLKKLKKEMAILSKKYQFEEAASLRDTIFKLEHIQDVSLIKKEKTPSFYHRIEAYDISNIHGAFAVGAMVVFIEGVAEKSEYRRFKIKTVKGIDDVGMMKEILQRRFAHPEWRSPDLIIIDGGRGQVNGALEVMRNFKIEIPVLGIAKGKDRKKDELILTGTIPFRDLHLFKEVRDEAHRFARGYYQKLHRRALR